MRPNGQITTACAFRRIHAKRGIKQTNVILLAQKYETAALSAIGQKQVILSPFRGHDRVLDPVPDL